MFCIYNTNPDIMMESRTSLKFATFNAWLIPEKMRIAQKTTLRTKHITSAVSNCDCDVLAMQEVWLPGLYKQSLLNPENFSKSYKYFHYFRAGAVGSGLVTFSKYPIVGVDYFQFTMCSSPFRVDHGDWFGAKGVGVCYIESPAGLLSVYNTHLIAEYNKVTYLEHRIVEAMELVRFIQRTARGHAILLGDLNFTPDSIEYEIVTKFGGLTDLWKDENSFFTFNLPNNPFCISNLPAIRIDYVMIPNGNKFEVIDKGYIFQETEDTSIWFSDHSGVQVKLNFADCKSDQISRFLPDSNTDMLLAAKNVLQKRIKKRSKSGNFPTSYIMLILLIVTTVLLIASVSIFSFMSLLFDTSSLLTHFLILVISLLLKFILFLFLTTISVLEINEINRLKQECVYIDYLLQSQQT